MRRVLISVLFAAMVGAAAGCSDHIIFSPSAVVAGSVPFTAPEIYADWWRETEVCSGRTGDLDRIHWYVVPNTISFDFRGTSYNGYWWDTHDIVLGSVWLDRPEVVRHEMLHDLLNSGEHPAEFFKERCGALVQ